MVLNAKLSDGITVVYTQAVFQYETNVGINIEGANITFPVVVDISNTKDRGNAVRYKAESMPLRIPDDYFVDGICTYIWVYTSDGIIQIVVPIMSRPSPVKAPDEGHSINYEYDEQTENLSFLVSLDRLAGISHGGSNNNG